jgi:hypothetical protein
MNDLTLLYYTANVLSERPAENIRKYLLNVTRGEIPIVSVSQEPLKFGINICVGKIGRTYYNCYLQILTGAEEVKTKYVACVEDDTLYSMEHFNHRPFPDTFAFNGNMWYFENDKFWRKYEGQSGMCGCIVETKLLKVYLEPRYKKFPEPPDNDRAQRHFQEPGRDDKWFGIENAKTEHFFTKIPLLTFNYFAGLGGKAITREHIPIVRKNIEPYGDCDSLHNRFWKGDGI